MREEESSFLSGAILGGLVGVALGILFSPGTGEEARRELKARIDDLSRSVAEGLKRLAAAVSEAKKAAAEKERELEKDF